MSEYHTIGKGLTLSDAVAVYAAIITVFYVSPQPGHEQQQEQACREIEQELHKIRIEKSDILDRKAKVLITLGLRPLIAERILEIAIDLLLATL